MKKQATTKSIKAAAAKATAAKKDKKVKKADLTKVGKNKPAKKAKDEVKKVKKADLTKVGKKDAKVKKEKKAESKSEVLNAYETALKTFKKPSALAARKLVIGDVIEVFYADQELGVLEIVVKSARKGEDIYNVATVTPDQWGQRIDSMTQVNSDMWRKVGTAKLNIKKD